MDGLQEGEYEGKTRTMCVTELGGGELSEPSTPSGSGKSNTEKEY